MITPTEKKRLICCVTGTRADYPRVKTVLREIVSRPTLALKLLVTGAHLSPRFGNTVSEIEKDGFEIAARIPIYDDDDTPYGMAKAAARCSDGIADALKALNPDMVLLTVDRIETLAAAQSAALMNVPIAHIQGGEVTGTIDESIRHAVTKLAHIHFPATADAAERIIKMGEDPNHVYKVGCPYIDLIQNTRMSSRQQLAKKYKLDPEKQWILFVQHPVTTEYRSVLDQIRESAEALHEFPEFLVVSIFSNADAGGRSIIRYLETSTVFRLFANMPETDYISLMKESAVMVGNSSSGIREAPSFRLPAVNIGSRQAGRLRAENVIDVENDRNQIRGAIRKALYNPDFRGVLARVRNPYGDGRSAKRIVDVLEKIDLASLLIQKRIRY